MKLSLIKPSLPGALSRSILLLLATALPVSSLAAETPTKEEMWEVIRKQQAEIDALKARLEETDTKVEDTAQAVELTADAVEKSRDEGRGGGWASRTSVGGYGELHYNNLEDDMTADGADDLDRVDFHRFVLFFGHEFTDDIRFFSEVELEHSLVGGGAPGAVELEQAWIEMDVNDRHRIRAGLDIVPVGIINPTHEPNTFYGVERNPVESEIIPTTWWEAGVAAMGEIMPGLNYDAVVHSGLAVPTAGGSAFRPRSGRLKVAEADDQDIAFTGRLRYTAIPGLEVGVSGQYQADITGTADAFDIGATLLEGHVDYKHRSGFGLRALYARWDLDDDNGLDPATFNADTLDGWYVEPAYRFSLGADRLGDLGIFARYTQWDERNRLGGAAFRYEEFDEFKLGMNWWPTPNVAFKFDVQWQDADNAVDRTLDGFNLGVGYQF